MVRMGILASLIFCVFAPVLFAKASYQLSVQGNRQVPKEAIIRALQYYVDDDVFDTTLFEQMENSVIDIAHKYGCNQSKAQVQLQDAPWRLVKKGFANLLVVHLDEKQCQALDSIHLRGLDEEKARYLEQKAWNWLMERMPETSMQGSSHAIDAIVNGRQAKTQQDLSYRIQTGPFFDEALLAELAQHFSEWLQDEGYYNALVRGPLLQAVSHAGRVEVLYTITQGPQSVISEIVIEGCSAELLEDVLQKHKLLKGAVFRASLLEEARFQLAHVLWNKAYQSARVKIESVRESKEKVRLRILVNLGDRVEIQSVEFRGHEKSTDGMLKANMAIHANEPYHEDSIRKSRSDLLKLDIFERVEMNLEAVDGMPERKRLVVNLKERPRTGVELGFGASLDDGPRVAAIYHMRNLFGVGLDMRTKAQLNYPAAFYFIPLLYSKENITNLESRFAKSKAWMKPFLYAEGKLQASLDQARVWNLSLPLSLGGDVSAQREIRQAFTLNKLGVLLRARLSFRDDVYLSPQLEGEWTDFMCADETFSGTGNCGSRRSALVARLDEGRIVQLTARLLLTYDGRDDVLFPHRGFYVHAGNDWAFGAGFLRGFKENSHSKEALQVRYTKIHALVSAYAPLGDKVVWSNTASAGQIFSLSQGAYVPLYKRFYLGGTNSLRGFREDAVFAADSHALRSEVPFGGNFFASLKSELRFPLYQKLHGAVFGDLGELLQDPRHFNLKALAVGTGLGIRYHTPIGPLLVDLGFRVHDHTGFPSTVWDAWRLHFSIGYS